MEIAQSISRRHGASEAAAEAAGAARGELPSRSILTSAHCHIARCFCKILLSTKTSLFGQQEKRKSQGIGFLG